ncbi:MAG TPA: hypothetical protein VFN21_13240 [Acidimicrobiales bacterium]|nr:hypothetical protein [Acidimicrobiales bacterium]
MEDDEDVLDELPAMMAVALRLRRAGHGDATIGTATGIPVEGVAILVEVAEAKLARLRHPGDTD